MTQVELSARELILFVCELFALPRQLVDSMLQPARLLAMTLHPLLKEIQSALAAGTGGRNLLAVIAPCIELTLGLVEALLQLEMSALPFVYLLSKLVPALADGLELGDDSGR